MPLQSDRRRENNDGSPDHPREVPKRPSRAHSARTGERGGLPVTYGIGMLFEPCQRDLTGGKPHGMGPFTYLDRSIRPEAARVRELLETLLAGYPQDHRESLKIRLTSDVEETHDSAFFELLLHELFRSRGYTLVAVEPEVPGSTKRPDFLFRNRDGAQFYVEAVSATGTSSVDRGRTRHRDDIRRVVDSIRHPNFWLGLHEGNLPGAPVATTRLRREIERWLDSLPPPTSVERESLRPREHAKRFRIGSGTESVHLTATPRNLSRGRAPRGVGVISHGVRIAADTADILRQKVEKKANRYGRTLPFPLVIAVNALMEVQDDTDVDDAIFGTIAVEATHSAAGYSERIVRLPDAIFRGPPRPTGTRIAAVMAFQRARPWRARQCSARIVLNPWAAQGVDLSELGLPQTRVDGGRLTTSAGQQPGDLLGLPPEWPEQAGN